VCAVHGLIAHAILAARGGAGEYAMLATTVSEALNFPADQVAHARSLYESLLAPAK
jgi:hypothetical protein